MARPTRRRRVILVAVVVLAVTIVAAHFSRALPAATPRIRLSFIEAFVLLSALLAYPLGLALSAIRTVRLTARLVRTQPRRPRDAVAALAWLLLFGWLVFLALYARFIEPTRIVIRETSLPLPGLRKDLRLVVFSDLHSDARFDLDDRVASMTNTLDADVIVFLGDALNAPDRAPAFRAALSSMRARYAKLAIRGNWDVWFWDDLDLFGGTGFVELSPGWHTIPVGENSLRIGAAPFQDAFDPGDVVGAVPPGDGPAIFLYHANDYVHAAAAAGVDLYLCGDTHGGQIEFPGYGAFFSVGRLGRDFTRGLYQDGRMKVYVTSGLGVERSLPLRLRVRPEITLLSLTPDRR